MLFFVIVCFVLSMFFDVVNVKQAGACVGL